MPITYPDPRSNPRRPVANVWTPLSTPLTPPSTAPSKPPIVPPFGSLIVPTSNLRQLYTAVYPPLGSLCIPASAHCASCWYLLQRIAGAQRRNPWQAREVRSKGVAQGRRRHTCSAISAWLIACRGFDDKGESKAMSIKTLACTIGNLAYPKV